MDFSSHDRYVLQQRGIDHHEALQQLELIHRGTKSVPLLRCATLGDGIRRIEAWQHATLLSRWHRASRESRLSKLVPASGAASRMFQSLLNILHNHPCSSWAELDALSTSGITDAERVRLFLDRMEDFAFHGAMVGACADRQSSLIEMRQEGRVHDVLQLLLEAEGLNFAALPKGLIPFHRVDGEVRTPMEEHLIETLLYAMDGTGCGRVHFTLVPQQEQVFRQAADAARTRLYHFGKRVSITYSLQDERSETLAATLEGEALRDDSGELVFRPGGHGALLGNVQALQADILYIKNIDNVAPDCYKETTTVYKKLLCGLLLELQEQVFAFLHQLGDDSLPVSQYEAVADFCCRQLNRHLPGDFSQQDPARQRKLLSEALHRPLRVCGMVRNEGEPGGGPFWVRDTKGLPELQIVELNQIQQGDRERRLSSATHFNPVDLVCGLRDHHGDHFDLPRFVDHESGLVQTRPWRGKNVRTLELPGLWNGAMAGWNTVFVEVPLETFTPVKTVFDLLRSEHRGLTRGHPV